MTLQERFKEAIEEYFSGDSNNYDKAAIACESITLEMMGEFAEWTDAEGYHQVRVGGIWQNSMDAKIPQEKEFTTPELIQKFLKRG